MDNEIASILSLGTLQLSRKVQEVTATAGVSSRLLQGCLSSAHTGGGGGEKPGGTGHIFAKRTALRKHRCAEPGMRAATKTRGMEFGTRSVKFVGRVGNCKPRHYLSESVSRVCVCVCVCSILALEESERDPKSLRCPDKPVLLRLWQNGRELSLNAHRHNTDRLTICNEIRSKYFCVRRYGIGAQPYVLGVLMESARN